ncbi:MAG: hypothetical protein JNM27_05500 [Leptospirales bacterium]|nr:hypothetical protein [Leptospirales bacterium]
MMVSIVAGWETITTFLTKVSPALALIGSALGLLTFYNQYLRRLKLKVFVNRSVHFDFAQQQALSFKDYEVNWIALSLSFGNAKNAYGLVQDLALGLYRYDSPNPKYIMFHASRTSAALGSESEPFAPLHLTPNSLLTKTVYFQGPFGTHKPFISIDKTYCVDLFVRHKDKGKWRRVARKTLHQIPELPAPSITATAPVRLTETTYSVLDIMAERSALAKTLPKPRTQRFTGVFAWWRYRFRKRAYSTIAFLPSWVADFGRILFFVVWRVWIANAFSFLLTRTIILASGEKKQDRAWLNRSEAANTRAFVKIIRYLQQFVLLHNSKHSQTEQVTIDSGTQGVLTLSKGSFHLKVYPTGPISIIAQTGNPLLNETTWELKQQWTRLGFFITTMNEKPISIYRYCVTLIDLVALYGRHPEHPVIQFTAMRQ